MTWELLPAAMWASQELPQQPMELHLGMSFFLPKCKENQSKARSMLFGIETKQAQGLGVLGFPVGLDFM